jgi:hypothetical protein
MRARAARAVLATAVTVAAFAGSFTAPAQGATWVFRELAAVDRGTALNGIACPDAHLCVAVDHVGAVFTSDPSRLHPDWRRTEIEPGAALTGIACPSAGLCVATDSRGDVAVTTRPTGGASAWRIVPIFQGHYLASVSCPSVGLCLAAAQAQEVLTSTDPANPAGAWLSTAVQTGPVVSCAKYGGYNCASNLVAVACPTGTLCLAADAVGDVFTTHAPTSGGLWSTTSVQPETSYDADLRSLSCPAVDLCVVSSDAGTVATTDNPAGPGTSWSDQAAWFWGGWVFCPMTTLCLSSSGTLTTDPLGGPETWRTGPLHAAGGLHGVSCPTRSVCLGVDGAGSIIRGTPASKPRPSGGRPQIRGATRVGRRLRASTGRWSGVRPLGFRFQWQRCSRVCVPVTGATSPALRVTAAERFWRLRVEVTASNIAGTARPRFSARTRPVA